MKVLSVYVLLVVVHVTGYSYVYYLQVKRHNFDTFTRELFYEQCLLKE